MVVLGQHSPDGARQFLEPVHREAVGGDERAVAAGDDPGEVAVLEQPNREPVLAEFRATVDGLGPEAEALVVGEADDVRVRGEPLAEM